MPKDPWERLVKKTLAKKKIPRLKQPPKAKKPKSAKVTKPKTKTKSIDDACKELDSLGLSPVVQEGRKVKCLMCRHSQIEVPDEARDEPPACEKCGGPTDYTTPLSKQEQATLLSNGPRYCRRCKCKLSMYNHGKICRPCAERFIPAEFRS